MFIAVFQVGLRRGHITILSNDFFSVNIHLHAIEVVHRAGRFMRLLRRELTVAHDLARIVCVVLADDRWFLSCVRLTMLFNALLWRRINLAVDGFILTRLPHASSAAL